MKNPSTPQRFWLPLLYDSVSSFTNLFCRSLKEIEGENLIVSVSGVNGSVVKLRANASTFMHNY